MAAKLAAKTSTIGRTSKAYREKTGKRRFFLLTKTDPGSNRAGQNWGIPQMRACANW
jgi:hypothetical protein